MYLLKNEVDLDVSLRRQSCRITYGMVSHSYMQKCICVKDLVPRYFRWLPPVGGDKALRERTLRN